MNESNTSPPSVLDAVADMLATLRARQAAAEAAYPNARKRLSTPPIEDAEHASTRRWEIDLDSTWDLARRGKGAVPTAIIDGRRRPLRAWAEASIDVLEINTWALAGHGVSVVLGDDLVAFDLEHESKPRADGSPKGTCGRTTFRALEGVLGAFPRTRVHFTKSGGLHYVVKKPRAAKVLQSCEVLRGYGIAAPGIDVVTGLLTAPITPGYGIAPGGDGPIADIPAAWLAAITEPPEQPRERVQREHGDDANRALEIRARHVASLSSGRGYAQNYAAYHQARETDLSEDVIVDALLAAAETNGKIAKDGRRAVERACRASIRKGRS